MHIARIATGVLAAAVTAAIARWQLAGRFVEEPAYTVERAAEGFELRRYAPMVRAETVVRAANAEDAAREGFRRLAGYIFGGNRARARVAMTAPVTQSSERVAMTAPVTQSASGDAWTIGFVMPPGRTLADLPEPLDARVVLREEPARRVAVRTYRGTSPPDRVARESRALHDTLAREGIATVGDAVSARYDPPSTLPFLRRNEVWIELATE